MGLIIHVDGASRGNPGPAAAGVVITDEDDTLLYEAGFFLGRQTNNAAEYHAVIRALTQARTYGNQTLCVCSDSQLLVRQVTGKYEVRSPKLAQLFRQVQVLLLRVSNWSFFHIPREENQRADELANLALDQGGDVVVFDVERGDEDEANGPSEAASPATSSTSSSGSEPDEPGTGRAVRVVMDRGPAEGGCPAGLTGPFEFTVQSELPASLCIHAAHGILTTVLAILSTAPEEFAAIPTLTVHCPRPACGATFQLSPVRCPNGKKRS